MDPPSPALEGTSELLVQGQGPVHSLGRAATLAVAVAPTGTSPPPKKPAPNVSGAGLHCPQRGPWSLQPAGGKSLVASGSRELPGWFLIRKMDVPGHLLQEEAGPRGGPPLAPGSDMG